MKPTRNDSSKTPYKPVTPLGFDPAYWKAIARFGADDFAAAVERYLRMQRANYDTLRGYAERYFSGRDLAAIQALIDSIQTEQDPLLSLAPQLGGEVQFSAPQPVMIDQPTQPASLSVARADELSRPDHLAKWEVDLQRICRTRREERIWRVWVYGQRAHDGSGKIEKDGLFAYLTRIGVQDMSRRTFDDIITAGMGTYWTAGYYRNAQGVESLHLFITGQKRLNKRITEQELKKPAYDKVMKSAPEHQPIEMRSVDTNRPGSVYVWGDLTGDLPTVRAVGYNAWMSAKAQRNWGYIDISRRVLEALWQTPRKTLIQWEKRAKMTVQPVYCESADPDAPLVPSYAYPALDVHGNEIATWRESNRYFPNPVDIHRHGGQRRKVRKLVNAQMEASEPANANGGGLRTGRLNFEHDKLGAKCIEVREDGSKRYTETRVPAKKLLKNHIKRHHGETGVIKHRHMLLTGIRYGVVIKELSTGDRFRSINDGRDLHAEATQEYRDRRTQYRQHWGTRWL